jgi:hypothetical protein
MLLTTILTIVADNFVIAPDLSVLGRSNGSSLTLEVHREHRYVILLSLPTGLL